MFCHSYLQIENYCSDRINLFIKIKGEWERSIDDLYYIFGVIKENSKDYNLDISKPSKYRVGEYTSVAIIDDVFIEKENGGLDLNNLIKKINSAIELIDNITDKL